eukprot:m.57003 g.57003  ORF g.57003 m.57003 type:complete len:348 (-) comp13700_c0_seq1:978-2021(-)
MASESGLQLSKTTSLVLVLVVYAAALGIAIGAGYALKDDLKGNVPLYLGMIGFGIGAFVVWLSSLLVNNSSMYDAFWSVAPQVGGIYWAIAASLDNQNVDPTRTALILIAVNLWATRLTSNWARGFPGLHHEDWRYLDIKHDMAGEAPGLCRKVYYWVCGSFLAIHAFPTVEIFLGSTPMYFGLYRGDKAVNAADYIGFVLTLVATLLELVADEQMKTFQKRSTDRQATCDSGLWRYSRHPNYLGEALFWWGLFLMGINANSHHRFWWTITGTVVISLMIYFISIPLMEQRQLKRRKQAYTQYMCNVPSRLFLWFRRDGEAEPLSPSTAPAVSQQPSQWNTSRPTTV